MLTVDRSKAIREGPRNGKTALPCMISAVVLADLSSERGGEVA